MTSLKDLLARVPRRIEDIDDNPELNARVRFFYQEDGDRYEHHIEFISSIGSVTDEPGESLIGCVEGTEHPVLITINYCRYGDVLIVMWSSRNRFLDRDVVNAFGRKHYPNARMDCVYSFVVSSAINHEAMMDASHPTDWVKHCHPDFVASTRFAHLRDGFRTTFLQLLEPKRDRKTSLVQHDRYEACYESCGAYFVIWSIDDMVLWRFRRENKGVEIMSSSASLEQTTQMMLYFQETKDKWFNSFKDLFTAYRLVDTTYGPVTL